MSRPKPRFSWKSDGVIEMTPRDGAVPLTISVDTIARGEESYRVYAEALQWVKEHPYSDVAKEKEVVAMKAVIENSELIDQYISPRLAQSIASALVEHGYRHQKEEK